MSTSGRPHRRENRSNEALPAITPSLSITSQITATVGRPAAAHKAMDASV